MEPTPAHRDQPDDRQPAARVRSRRAGLKRRRRSWAVIAGVGGALGLAAAVGLLGGDGRGKTAGASADDGDPAGLAAENAVPGPGGGEASPDGFAGSAPPGVLRFGPGDGELAVQYPHEWHEFYFTRAAYNSWRGRGGRGQSWAIDYPKSDRQFVTVLKRLTNLDAYDDENAILLTDTNIRRFPFLYALEVGYMDMSPPEIEGLRDYLYAGGFLVIDDFWGTQEWANFEYQMGLLFPGRPIIDLELDHPVFNTFYEIDEILQVPAYGRSWGGQTSERDGFVPYVKGIEDDEGRLMVIINWNTDLGDAWEWAEQPDYPLQYSTFAFQMGVNMIVYAMSH